MAIEVSNIYKSWGPKTVVNKVSLRIEPGQVTAFIGPNGAGKSTLLSLICRLIHQDSGQVSIDRQAINTIPTRQLAHRLSFLKQHNHIGLRISVEDLVGFGRFPYSQGRLTPEDGHHIDQAIEFMGLQDLRTRYLDQLSGGQRQRAFIAMILAQDTPYVLLDEPLNNLDMRFAGTMMQSIQRMVKEKNKAVALVIHDINFAANYADMIYALKDGCLIHAGTPEQIMQESILQEIFDFSIPVHKVDGKRIGIYF